MLTCLSISSLQQSSKRSQCNCTNKLIAYFHLSVVLQYGLYTHILKLSEDLYHYLVVSFIPLFTIIFSISDETLERRNWHDGYSALDVDGRMYM